MTRLFWRKPFTVTLAFVMALALPLCGMFSLLASAEDNDIIYKEVEADGGGDDVVCDDIVFADDSDGDEIEESEPEDADEDNGGQEAAIPAYAVIEDDGGDNAAPDEDTENGDNEAAQAMFLGEADVGDADVATPGNTESDEEAEQEEIEEAEPEEPQIITIAAFAELADEILYQGFDLPAEDAPPLTLGDINLPMSLEATDIDGNGITVALDMWLCEDYDLAVSGMYTFTAKRPDGYALGDGVAMPEIVVIVRPADLAIAPMAEYVDGSTISGTISEDIVVPTGATVTVTGVVAISGTVTISGGGTIKRGFTGVFEVGTGGMFVVGSGATLILEDIIIDGNRTEFESNKASLVRIEGGAVTINSGATLQNNTAQAGSGVYLASGTLNMNGGKIIDNIVSSNGGGVFFSDGTFNLGGTSVISGNTNFNGTTKSNVFLSSGKTITLPEYDALNGMYVGITLANATGIFTNQGGIMENAKFCFFSDVGKTVKYTYPDGGSVSYFEITDEAASPLKQFKAQIEAFNFFINESDMTIYVTEDITLDALQMISNASGKTLTITGGGTITRDIAGNLFTVGDGTGLILQNITIDGGKNNGYPNGGILIAVGIGSTLEIRTGAVLQNNSNGSNFSSVFTDGGTITMNGGEIRGNTITGTGGAVSVNYGTFNMSGGTISGNTASGNGGGVYLGAGGILNMSGNAEIINNNSSGGNGGGVYLNSSGSKFTMSGGEISGNTASGNGGGVYVADGTLTLGGTAVVSGNTSNNVYLPSGKYITLASPVEGMNIGITHATTIGDVAITNGTNATDEIAECFTSDNEDRTVICTDGVLYLTNKAISISGATVEQSGTLTYNGEAQTPAFTVKVGGETLVAGTDYSVTGSATNAGDYTATITGINGYKDAITGVGYTINKATLTVMPNATINTGDAVPATANLSYIGFVTGDSIDNVTITGAVTLTSADYTVGSKAGTYTLTANVSGLSSANYDFTAQDGTLTVTLQPNVTTFAQLKAAVQSYADYTDDTNMTITVGANITMTELLSIPANSGKTLTITSEDGETFTLTRGTGIDGNLFTIPANASLILENIVVDGGGISQSGSLVNVSGAFAMESGATLQNNKTTGGGGGVYVASGGVFTLNGGTITGNAATGQVVGSDGGGGVYIMGGAFTMASGEIRVNTASMAGGVNVYSGTFTMQGGTISGNTLSMSYSGGGVNVGSYGTFTMTGGTITDNTAYTGGGVYVSGTFKLGGAAKITGNLKSSSTNNVHLASGKTITLLTDIDTDELQIGITHATATGDIAITNTTGEAATDEIAKCFASDNDARYINLNADTNVLQLSTRIEISEATVTHSPLTYDGTAQMPTLFTVTYGGETLVEDVDYTLSAVTPQTNAGTHENAATITGIGKYTGTAPVSVTIGQRDLDNVTIAAIEALTYTGANQEPTISVSDSDITISENDYNVTYTDNKNAGTATLTLNGKGNYTGTKEATFEIEKAPLTIKANDYGLVKYNDPIPEQSVYSVTYSGFVGGEDENTENIFSGEDENTENIFSGTLSYATDYTQGSSVGGSYYIAPSGLTSANYDITYENGALTVGKGNQAELSITGKPTGDITYGDDGFTLVTTGGSGIGAVTYEVTSGTNVLSVNETTGAVTIEGAGDATITATKASDDSYVEKTASVDITVAKAALTVTAEDKSVNYGETPTFTVTYSGFVNGEGATNLDGALDFTCNYTTESPAGSTHEIWPKDLTSDNYDITFVKGTLTVTKAAQNTITITDPGIKTWGDVAFQLETEGGSGDGEVSYTIVSGDDVISISGNTVTILKAGTATVTATKAGDDNYNAETSAAITITVNKAEQSALTITGGNIIKTYGDNTFMLSTSGGDGDGAVSYTITSGSDVISITGNTVTILKAGSATVTATKAGDDKYNAATSAAITVTVERRDITSTGITVTVADDTYTYKGAEHTPSYSVTDSGATITDNDYNATYSNNIDAGAGATITITAADDGNYTGETSATFTIVPAALTITGKSFELTYGDDAPDLDSFDADDVTVEGLMERDAFPSAFTGTLTFAYDLVNSSEYMKGSDTGKYYIDPSGLSSNNYTITYVNGVLTVKQAAQAELIITDPGTKTWGDVAFDLSTGNTGSGDGNVAFGVTDGDDVISISDGTATILKAGTATVTAIKAESTNYLEATADLEITVNPRDIADANISVTSTHTYTGLAQTPTFTVTDSGATITSNDYNATYGENKNVSTGGSVTIAGKGNYTGTKTATFAIGKAILTVAADNKTISYGAEIPAYTYTITGYVNNETASVITGTPILSCSYIKGYSVGGYFIDVDVSGLTAANYSITDASGRLNVQTTAGAPVSAAPAVAMKTAASITVSAVANAAEAEQLALIPEGVEGSAQSVEYALSTSETAPTAASDWQESTTFTELAQSTTYYAFARTAANNNYYAGVAQMSAAIETDGLYTVQFAVTNSGAASGSTIKATYDGAEISSGTTVQGGKTLVLTASGKGASTYSYSWTVNDTKDGSTASITIENLSKAVNATCTVSGTAASSSRESSSSREESSSQAESSVAESSSQAESSVAESSASSSEAEQPASSVSEASSVAESVSEAAAESSVAESVAESSAAVESTAESARAAESDSERDNARDSDSDRSRSDSDSNRETKKEPETVAEAIKEISEKAGEVINEMFSGARTPVGPAMDLSLDVDIGSAVYGRGIMLNAKGLKPFTEIKVTVYSEPQVLGIQTADEYGEASLWAVFPEDLEEGIHTVIADGIGTLEEPVQSVSMVEIDGKGILLKIMESSQVMEPIDPGDKTLVRAMEAGKPIYDPSRHPGTVAGATLAICVTGGGLAAMAGLSKPGKHSRNREERRSNDGEGLGDGGFLWKLLPFRAASDRFSIGIQEATSRISFTLYRFVSDGVWSRAMFGSGGFLLWILGAGLGYYASMQVGFKALPPDFIIVLAIVALGFLDAGAGFMAWLMIALCAVCTGHVAGLNDVCTLLGMFTLFAALMTLSGSRPLRREYEHSKKFVFDRIMDYIIPTVYLMLASSAILNVINGLSGLELFSEENGRTIKLVSVVALWARLALEDIAINLFPRRYSQVYADVEIKQSFPLILGAIALYISMFVIVSIPFFGFGIMLMFLLALDIIPSLLMYAEDYLPNSKFLSKWYPGADSTYASLVLTVIGVFLTLQLMTGTTDYRNMSVAMVILAIPTAVAEIPSLFGRDEIIQRGWFRRLAEVGCWALFALISLDIIKLV